MGKLSNYKTTTDFSKVVTIQDIAENGFSLNIPLYVKPSTESFDENTKSVRECFDCWKEAADRMKDSYRKLNELLGEGAQM